MQICLLKSKIHRATITDGNLKYEGGLTIAADLMKKCGLIAYERILCSNMANGNRFETYAIPGDPGSGQIVLNGAAAFQGKRGDVLTIMSFAHVPKHKIQHWKPRVIVLRQAQSHREGTRNLTELKLRVRMFSHDGHNGHKDDIPVSSLRALCVRQLLRA